MGGHNNNINSTPGKEADPDKGRISSRSTECLDLVW
jgi:hypothetical protein